MVRVLRQPDAQRRVPFWRPPQGKWAAVTEEEYVSQNLARSLPLGTTKTQQVSFYVYYQNFCDDFYPWEQSTGWTSWPTEPIR